MYKGLDCDERREFMKRFFWEIVFVSNEICLFLGGK